jgi:diadenosine tetraphosphate (Ap4A) HIT family hydrolase
MHANGWHFGLVLRVGTALAWAAGMNLSTLKCPFCEIEEGQIIAQNTHAIAIRDAYPVTPLHTLILPRRHVHDVFGMGQLEVMACMRLLDDVRRGLLLEDPLIAGFNVGTNAGEVAGQSVFHCHWHLIPRRRGDVAVPKGGIRNLIRGGASPNTLV